ncbi:MAG: carbohydrate ABC transporter permease, partial [Mesorhizobium sp.]
MSAPGRSGSSRLARKRLAGHRALLATLMLLVAVASAFPLLWMVLSSLKTPAETMQVPPVWIPRTPSLEAYENVSGVINVGRSMWNSLVIASITT